MPKRTIAFFLISLIIATWLLQWTGLSLSGWDPDSEAMTPWLIVAMFAPAIWSVAYLIRNPAARSSVQWRPGNWKRFVGGLVVAPLIPAAMALLILAVVLLAGWGTSEYFSFAAGGAEIARGPWVLGGGAQNWGLFLGNIALTALVFGFLNGVVAVGEEFGWRGLLQPNMISAYGLTSGVLLLGLAWGLWHLPVNLAGYNHPDSPVLGSLILFPLSQIAHSFILALLTLWARSFWPAVVFHGSVNGIYEGIVAKIVLNPGMTPLCLDWVVVVVDCAVALGCWWVLVRQFGTDRKASTPAASASRSK